MDACGQLLRSAFNPNDPPKSMPERLVRLMPASNQILPAGDVRDWADIEAWAHTIAVAVQGMPSATPAGVVRDGSARDRTR